MKVTVYKHMIILSVLLLINSVAAVAKNNNNLIYNTEEKDGLVVSQLVYKMDNGQLTNYEKFSYTYNDQRRVASQEKEKWNAAKNNWEKEVCIHYTYSDGKKHITYEKWNNRKKAYEAVPEMNVSVEDTEAPDK